MRNTLFILMILALLVPGTLGAVELKATLEVVEPLNSDDYNFLVKTLETFGINREDVAIRFFEEGEGQKVLLIGPDFAFGAGNETTKYYQSSLMRVVLSQYESHHAKQVLSRIKIEPPEGITPTELKSKDRCRRLKVGKRIVLEIQFYWRGVEYSILEEIHSQGKVVAYDEIKSVKHLDEAWLIIKNLIEEEK